MLKALERCDQRPPSRWFLPCLARSTGPAYLCYSALVEVGFSYGNTVMPSWTQTLIDNRGKLRDGLLALTRTTHRIFWIKSNEPNSFHVFLFTRAPTEKGRSDVHGSYAQALESNGTNQIQTLPFTARWPQIDYFLFLHIGGLICKSTTSDALMKMNSDYPGTEFCSCYSECVALSCGSSRLPRELLGNVDSWVLFQTCWTRICTFALRCWSEWSFISNTEI